MDLYLQPQGGVWTLTIDRPAAKNAISQQTMGEFEAHLAELEAAAAPHGPLRALVLTGAGGQFIAGGDLKDLPHLATPADVEAMSRRMQRILARLGALPVPVIAAVEGHAIGGGCEVALACDLRVSAENARFSFWEVRQAVTTGWGGGQRLVGLLGPGRALDLLLTGRTVSAAEAANLGLVERVAPPGGALAAAQELAEQIAGQPPLAVAALKRLVRGVSQLPPAAAEALETELFVQTWFTDDHREAVAAFLAKRSPVWHVPQTR